MIDKRTYEVARKNLDVRQSFLDTIDMEKYTPFVKRIQHHNLDKISGKFIMGTNSFFNFGRQATINIGNLAFEKLSPEDFYNSLIHHEGVHAEQLYQNPLTLTDIGKNFGGIVFKRPKLLRKVAEREIAAYGNQIDDISFAECSPRYQEKTRKILKLLENSHKKIFS